MGKEGEDFAGLAEISGEGRKEIAKKVSGASTGEKKKKKKKRKKNIN